MRREWSQPRERQARVLTGFRGMTAQMRDTGVYVPPEQILAEFHVDRAKAEDPGFARSLEKAAAEYVRELAAPRDPIMWEGDDA